MSTDPSRDRLLGAQLPRVAESTPEAIALIFQGRSWTYAELDAEVGAVAATLRAEGLGRGDVLVMAGVPRPEALITMYAAARVGAVLTPVNASSTSAELDVILAATPPAACVGDAAFLDRIATGALRLCWDADVPGTRALRGRLGLAPVREWDCGPGDEAIIAHTSGTSGRPKGAVLTHENLYWSARNALPRLDIRAEDVVLVATPLAHVAVLAGLPLYAWIVGATVVLTDGFDPDGFVDAVEQQGVTIAFAVSAMLSSLLRGPRWHGLGESSLRWILAGGGPPLGWATVSLAEIGVAVVNSYGLTEASAGVTYADPAEARVLPNSAGTPVDHVELRVVTPAGLDAGADVAGEIWLRGPSIAREYVLADGARDAALDADGWLRTGDCGALDSAGRLVVTGRLKDTIVTGGENVDPVEVENAILQLPGIAEVAVIATPDDVWGEVVTALVVLAPGGSLTLPALRSSLATTLSAHKVPRRLLFADSLPRTTTGKLKRLQLRAAAIAAP